MATKVELILMDNMSHNKMDIHTHIVMPIRKFIDKVFQGKWVINMKPTPAIPLKYFDYDTSF